MKKETASKFLVSYLYKWILPLATTFVMVFWADWETSLIIRFMFWLLLISAYISIPWNFENPKPENYEAYIHNKILYPFFVSLQVLFLSFFMFILTSFACIWFIPFLKSAGFVLGILNATLYAGCIIFEFARLPVRFVAMSQKEKH